VNAEQTADKISGWISDRTREAGARGVAVGISGGIDSALVLALAQRGLGPNVLGVMMPCESCEQDIRDALEVAGSLGVATASVHLGEAYRRLLDAVPPGSDLARANLKARLRMATLYFCANTLNYLVAGTGNRTERAVGYFTKHGDGAADILPIGGLLKRQVRELAAHLGLPRKIIEKPPSAGLWPGQTDEQEMGISYEALDEIVDAIESGRTPHAPADLVAKVHARMDSSGHKRICPPVCEVGEA
jgi:NAD+ synthase